MSSTYQRWYSTIPHHLHTHSHSLFILCVSSGCERAAGAGQALRTATRQEEPSTGLGPSVHRGHRLVSDGIHRFGGRERTLLADARIATDRVWLWRDEPSPQPSAGLAGRPAGRQRGLERSRRWQCLGLRLRQGRALTEPHTEREAERGVGRGPWHRCVLDSPQRSGHTYQRWYDYRVICDTVFRRAG